MGSLPVDRRGHAADVNPIASRGMIESVASQVDATFGEPSSSSPRTSLVGSSGCLER
jgi:hypothetical protein